MCRASLKSLKRSWEERKEGEEVKNRKCPGPHAVGRLRHTLSESRTFSSIRRVTAFEFTPRRVGKPSHLFTVAAGLRNAAAFEEWIKALHSMVLGSELPLSLGAWEGPRARLASSDGITEEGSR